MWFLIREPQGGGKIDLTCATSKWALLPGMIYTVGRVKSDIVPNLESWEDSLDQTVSGRHAKIEVIKCSNKREKPEVVVTDVGSNYGTFIDDAVNDPTIRFESFNKGEPGKAITKAEILKENARIKFGALSFVLRLVWIPLEVITSMLKDTKELKSNLREIGHFDIHPKWSTNTTHLVMTNVQLSPKVLTCIVTLVPIVQPQYFKDFLSCMKTKQRLPDVDKYLPPALELQLQDPDINLCVNPARKTFFKGKEFVFLDNSNKDLENVLKETGAKVVHVNQETQVDDPRFDSNDVIVVKPKEVNRESQMAISGLLQYLKSVKRITVALNTIYIAIMKVDANVCINQRQSGGRLLSSSSISSVPGSSNIRVKETQNIFGGTSTLATTATVTPPWALESSDTTQVNSSNLVSKNQNVRKTIENTNLTSVPNTLEGPAPSNKTESMIPPTNRNIESFLPPTNRNTENMESSRRKNRVKEFATLESRPSAHISEYSTASTMKSVSSEITQKKRPLSMDSDTEDQENKRPNISTATNNKQPNKTTQERPVEPKIRETPTAKSARVDDNDDIFGGDDGDLFNFAEVEEMTTTNRATASGKNKVANSTVFSQGMSAGKLAPSLGLSNIKKRKAQPESDEEDVFGFGDEDDLNDIGVQTATNNQFKRIKELEKPSQASSTDYSPLPRLSTVKLEQNQGSSAGPQSSNSTMSTSTNPSVVDTTGFLKKNPIKQEDVENMSHLADEFCTIIVADLIRDKKDTTSRSGMSELHCRSAGDSTLNNQSSFLSQGTKNFHKQRVSRPHQKIPLVKALIHDEQDRSVADWFVQNPEASQALDDEEREKDASEAFWRFQESQSQRSISKFTTRVK